MEMASSLRRFGCSIEAMIFASSKMALLELAPSQSCNNFIATGILTSFGGLESVSLMCQNPLWTAPNAPQPRTSPCDMKKRRNINIKSRFKKNYSKKV